MKRRLIWLALASSFLIHLLFLTGVYVIAPLMETKKPETIEVTLAPPPPPELTKKEKKENEKQIVRQALVPEQMKVPEDDTLARFLSEQKQRVKQESQASQNGMTENRSNKSTQIAKKVPPQQAQKPRQKEEQKPAETKDKDGYRTVDISKDLQEMNQLNDGRSSIGEALPTDVKVGSLTALNTDRYLFYTFYARIEELLRYRWETRVMQSIEGFDRITATNAGNHNWVTEVEFLLDSRGFLQKVIVMKESGMKSFDAAAVNALKDARVFPNPPREMIKEDGLIHIKYGFLVNYVPPVLVNRN
ncbi:MAG TPA: TonB family protein [Bdellovibrio sp.]|uniref:TonB family protein n=1 Tax=Bdellovibrio sp. TaxID=28201 RepID=UPI002EE0C1D6